MQPKSSGTAKTLLPAAHVWLAQAAIEPSTVVSALLSPAERDVVAAKRQDVDAYRSATARVLLKLLLTQEFGIDPFSVTLLVPAGLTGKPLLRYTPSPGLHQPLEASISHAGGQVLVAVTHGAALGVDVEEHRATNFTGFDDVALSAQECVIVASLPQGLRARQRADFWVRKEAVLKALDVGLLRDPAQMDFSDAGTCSTSMMSGHPPVAVQLLRATSGYSAALAVRGAAAVVSHETLIPATDIVNYATKT